MAPQGPPTDEDAAQAPAADEPSGKPSSPVSSSKQRQRRFQYATGDRPLAGYTIKRGVGRGGFGDVYFATSDAGKEVALKLVRRNFEVELRGVRQCLNLKHPNLVALYDVREDEGGDQWVVMEYVGGESLADAIDRCPSGMAIDDAVAWFRGVAAGVAHLHDAGIVHRDLKPANVYLEVGGGPIWQRVKVGDCGLSKFMTASRRSGQTESIGTVHYMAPEIASGRYGREVDIYALGVILYELLVGAPPFVGESVAEVLFKHVSAEPDLRRVPAPYRPAIAAALAKDPESRPSTVGAMLTLLPTAGGQAAVASAPVAEGAAPAADPPEVWTPVSRPPHTDHPKPIREPLWAAMEDGVSWLSNQYRTNPAPPVLKGLVLFGAVALALFSGAIAIPLAILPFYIVYYIIWSIFLSDPSAQAPAGPVGPNGRSLASASKPTGKPFRRKRPVYDWRAIARSEWRDRPRRSRAASFSGSLLTSGFFAALAGLVATMLTANFDGVDRFAIGVWTAAVVAVGAWGTLLTGALADRHLEDMAPRRGLGLITGLVVGAFAAGLAIWLGQGTPFDNDWAPRWNDTLVEDALDANLFNDMRRVGSTAFVPVTASAAYFGILFLALRWWKSTDYVRTKRVGFWSIAMTAVLAWLATLVTWYPQPAGMILAGFTVLAVEAGSAWCPPSRRAEIARRGPANREVV